jgi:predicted NUDIX family phosphoesterase
MEELVFALPAGALWKLLTYKEAGLIRESSDVLKQIVQKGLFRKRSELEEEPSFKQVISYAVISNNNSFYLFKRSSGQTEKRLHNQYSLGVGGHMNPGHSEESNEQYFINELKREFFEEVGLLNGCSIEEIEFIGVINDDTIPVGRVHIGLLYNIHMSDKHLVVNETNRMTAEWVDKSDLGEFYDAMETWSKIVFDQYLK